MIGFSSVELISRLRNPLERFRLPEHLPFAWIPFVPASVAWLFSLFFDLYIVAFVGSLIRLSRSRSETGLYIGLLGVFLFTPARYFLPRFAATLWWLELAGIGVVLLSSIALFSELLSPNSRPAG